MESTVSRAIELHRNGELVKALELYDEALQEKTPLCSVFLNASSILRGNEQQKKAVEYLKQGIKLYPKEAGLWNNLGNSYMDLGNAIDAIHSYRKALSIEPESIDPLLSLTLCLREIGCQHLSYALVKNRFENAITSSDRRTLLLPLVEAILAIYSSQDSTIGEADISKILEKVEIEITSDSNEDPCRTNLLMTQLWLQVNDLDNALSSREKLFTNVSDFLNNEQKDGKRFKKSFVKNWNNINWNLSIQLLKQGRLQEGWSLYDYGLQVEAAGPQRWQRSLNKPYSAEEIKFWRGESLTNKKILVLGEQGIGDTMMFATLLNKLSEEGADIYFCPGDRLLSIYKRSFHRFNIISLKTLKNKMLPASNFDYQTPIGSVCQYRFKEISDYGNDKTLLIADKDKTNALRKKYYDGRPLIGISWQGGGKANRIPLKSMSLMQLKPILERKDFRFVSLQYGDDKPHLKKFEKATGINVIHDDMINPLKDMDTWLCQVAAMDAVVSIANTTVHGSGGCGIPTLCFVSQQSDWRWINPDIYSGCYWYDSVQACYQSSEGSWDGAVADASKWLDEQFV